MTGAVHVTAHAAARIPQYCQSGVWHKPLTSAQWATCWKAGWGEPTTTAARAGYTFGHTIAPVLLGALLVLALLIAFSRSRSRRPAPAGK